MQNNDLGIKPVDEQYGEVDWYKFLKVTRKSLPWLLLILISVNVLAYIIVRYTKPIFESSSEIKLNIKQEASMFGFGFGAPEFEENQNINTISGEIELIKSKLFFRRLINSLNLHVKYETNFGTINNEERFKNSPIRVNQIVKNPVVYDTRFLVDIISPKEFSLSYFVAGEEKKTVHQFGDTIRNKLFEIQVLLKDIFFLAPENKSFVFTIQSDRELVDYIGANLTVEPLNFNANTIQIKFQDHNPVKARNLVNAIDSIYLAYSKEEKSKANNQKISFLNEQLASTERKLEGLDNYFEDFTINNKTTNVQKDISRTILMMEELDSHRYVVQSKILKVNELQNRLKNNTHSELLPGLSSYPKEINDALNELYILDSERKLLLSSYKENTFAVREQNEKYTILKENLINLSNSLNEQLNKTNSDLSIKKSRLEKNLSGLPSKGTEYVKSTRSYELYEQFFLNLMEKKAEFEIAQAGTVTDFVILSDASLPSTPISPNKLIIHSIGLVASIFICFIFIGISYLLHNKISNQSELERLTSAPFLGFIPFYNAEKLQSTKLIIDRNPKSAVSEALRSIRTNMEFLAKTDSNRIISITSTVSGEGKTFVSVNLGGIIALSNLKVVIVDLDMRKPKVHLAFSKENSAKGVSTILINKHTIEDSLTSTSLKNLDFICAGPTPPNPSELILTDEFDEMMNKLKKLYDVVILDTPPVGLVTDGILAMKKADLPIYVFRADYSKKSFTKALNRLINVNRFDNISVVLNSVKATSGYGYGYGYGYGNGYYSDDVKNVSLKDITNISKT